MGTVDDTSLREYLRQLSRRVKDPPCIPEYDEFLLKVWDFFGLRVAAENYFEQNKHVAISKRGPLPVSWQVLRETWKTSGPPEQIISLIAKRNYNDVNSLVGNLRKVLTRVRQKVAIGRVQQVDAHCLRWLTRQPGRSAAEKGGSRQEILGVVRVENYNTLENRVLKDFLSRCLALSAMYLRRYAGKDKYKEHVNIKAVARFKNLCVAGLGLLEMDKVSDIRDFPQPNYVLQQDRLYSKVWRAYCDVMRQEDVAERLWNRRNEIDDLYAKCNEMMDIHCSPCALYDTPLWICELDGRGHIFENPIWDNEQGPHDIVLPDPSGADIKVGDVTIVDFTYPWDGRDELVYPSSHRNARPFLQNKRRPSLEPGHMVSISEILQKKNSEQLADYFMQLYGLLKGARWVVLVPDDWDSMWLESVLRAANVLSRDRVFLLWRSVAAVLGYMGTIKFLVGMDIVVSDGFVGHSYNAVSIRFMKDMETGRVLPQRASTRLHSGVGRGEVRFKLEQPVDDHRSPYVIGTDTANRLCVGILSEANFISLTEGVQYSPCDKVLYEGVRRYLKEEKIGLVSYFDELDELSLVVQNRAEEVEFKVLVAHDECSPGGKPYHGAKTLGGALQQGESKVSLNLLEGAQDDSAPLKTLEVDLDALTPEKQDIYFRADVTPGQGLASVVFMADFLEKPIPLDLAKLKPSDLTKARIERDMKRHFPPVMPFVEANEDLWLSVKEQTIAYINGESPKICTDLFHKPRPYFNNVGQDDWSSSLFSSGCVFDPDTMSPIDKLKRVNVFGNAEDKMFPENNVAWDLLFKKLAVDYAKRGQNLRLIAWTYQHEKGDVFEAVRKDLYRRYVLMGETLSTVEYSFCSNCFGDDDRRVSEIVRVVLERIANRKAREEEFRLAYNLLQFHPRSLREISSNLCEDAFKRVYGKYNTEKLIDERGYIYLDGQKHATKLIGYYLKCMLFILHRRRFDPGFLNRSHDWKPSGKLAIDIVPRLDPNTGKEYPSQRAHADLRKSFLKYVRGDGRIEGIPLGD